MKILHTSDWHLGKMLYKKSRYAEHDKFINWLISIVDKYKIDTVIIPGDIFDTTIPQSRAQGLYYGFLEKIGSSHCSNVIITSGNHDSASFLNAPSGLLKNLNIHVLGQTTGNPEDEVIIICNSVNIPELIVCAVPYLKESDLRGAVHWTDINQKNAMLYEGMKSHFAQVYEYAENQRKKMGMDIPVIMMAHLFMAGGTIVEGDGVREIYSGNIAGVDKDVFSPSIDYVALGHLHSAQTVGGVDNYRYSGSPIPIGVNEVSKGKKVVIITFKGRKASIVEESVPVFQEIVRLQGDYNELQDSLAALKDVNKSVWVDIEYFGSMDSHELSEHLSELVYGSKLEILAVKTVNGDVYSPDFEGMEINDMTESGIFEKCMEVQNIPAEERELLRELFRESLLNVYEKDCTLESDGEI